MKYFRVTNLEKHQHYKKRNPPWIKLHATAFDDYEFLCLQDASKAHLMLIWLLASKLENRIPYDPQFVANKIGATEPVDLEALESHGFIESFEDASRPLAQSKQNAPPETEREPEAKTERERHISVHERVREALPKEYRSDLDSLLDTALGKQSERESWVRGLHAVLFDGYEFPSRDPKIIGQGLREMLGTPGAATWRKFSGFVRRQNEPLPQKTEKSGTGRSAHGADAIELAAGKQLEEIKKLVVSTHTHVGIKRSIPLNELQELPPAVQSAIAALGGSLISGAQRIVDTPADKYGILLSQFTKLYAGAINTERARIGANA